MAFSNFGRFFLLLLLAALCFPITCARAQLLARCDLRETALELALACLAQVPGQESSSSIGAESCCLALDQALQSGSKCLCILAAAAAASADFELDSITNFPSVTLALQFPGCSLSFPASLPDCSRVVVQPKVKPAANKQPVVPPTAAAPAAKPIASTTSNSSQPQNQTHGAGRSANAVPPAEENPFRFRSEQVGSVRRSYARQRMCDSTATFVWIAAIFAWLVV